MNKNQKIVAIVYVLMLLIIVTYIPFYVVSRDTGSVVYNGYEFIFNMNFMASPNIPMLAFELLIASIVAAVGYFALKEK